MSCSYGFYDMCPKSHAYCVNCEDYIKAKEYVRYVLEHNPKYVKILVVQLEHNLTYNPHAINREIWLNELKTLA